MDQTQIVSVVLLKDVETVDRIDRHGFRIATKNNRLSIRCRIETEVNVWISDIEKKIAGMDGFGSGDIGVCMFDNACRCVSEYWISGVTGLDMRQTVFGKDFQTAGWILYEIH